MKKNILLSILICLFLLNYKVIAEEASSSSEPETSVIEEQQIKELKDKIATKVAEINEKNNRAIAGYITNIKDKTIKVKNDEDEYEVNTDDTITKFFKISGNRESEIKLQTLEEGDYILINGLINDKKIDANFIYTDESYLVKSGKVSEVNLDDYYIKIVTNEKENYTLDIESYTKRQMLNIKNLELEAVGFSKIKEGDTIHFVVKAGADETEKNRFSAQKILIIPQEFFIK